MSWSRKVALRAGWMALALVACAPESDDLPRLTPDAGGDAAPAASGCKRAGPGPRSIADVVALLNELYGMYSWSRTFSRPTEPFGCFCMIRRWKIWTSLPRSRNLRETG